MNLHNGTFGGVTILNRLKWLAGSVSCYQQIQNCGFFHAVWEDMRGAEDQHRGITGGTGAGTISGDRKLLNLADFKADPVVLCDIVQLSP